MMAWLRRTFCRPKREPTATYEATMALLREQRAAANQATKELRRIQTTGNLLSDLIRQDQSERPS